jgi:hypothetical protein
MALGAGQILRRYAFKGLGGLHVDPASNGLYILDAASDDVTPRRFVLRRFQRDGTFEVAVALGLEGEKAPDAVDGMAFGAYGTPFYLYRDDERLVLRRLYTATPRDVAGFPSYLTPRAGLAALGGQGRVLTLGVLRLDPEEKTIKTRKKREVVFVQADPEGDPVAIFNVPDPFEPTVRMAVGPGGVLHLFGADQAGRLGCKRLGADQALTDLPLGLARMPDTVAFDPQGRLWLAYNSLGSEPASLDIHDGTGARLGRFPVRLDDGARVFQVAGLAFDRAGVPLVAGRAMYDDLRTVEGVFEFPRPR